MCRQVILGRYPRQRRCHMPLPAFRQRRHWYLAARPPSEGDHHKGIDGPCTAPSVAKVFATLHEPGVGETTLDRVDLSRTATLTATALNTAALTRARERERERE